MNHILSEEQGNFQPGLHGQVLQFTGTFYTCYIEHGTHFTFLDLSHQVPFIGQRTGCRPGTIVLVHLPDFFIERHQFKQGIHRFFDLFFG